MGAGSSLITNLPTGDEVVIGMLAIILAVSYGALALGAQPETDGAALAEWLDYCEIRRQCIIQELRQLDRILVDNGRLRAVTLPKRVR